MYRTIIPIALALLLLAGCATKRIPFQESEYAGLTLTGSSTVTGQIFLVDQLESKQVGGGSEVTLEPVTSYSDQWYEIAYLNNRSLTKPDPRYRNYVIKSKADDEGNFSFNNVGPGRYYLSGLVYWHATNCSGEVLKMKVPVAVKIDLDASAGKVEVPLTKEFVSPIEICGLYNQGAWEKVEF